MLAIVQFTNKIGKIYPKTIPSGIIIERDSNLYTLDNVLDDINILKNNTSQPFSFEEMNKLSKIENEANKYIYPDTHLATVIQ